MSKHIYILLVLGIFLTLSNGKSNKSTMDCDICVAQMPVLLEVRGNYFLEDYHHFRGTLLDVCHSIYDEEDLFQCTRQVLSYTKALLVQAASRHSYEFTSFQACSILSSCTVPCCSSDLPEQVHLSLTNDPSEMVVMWVSANPIPDPTVIYYQDGVNTTMTVTAVHSTYTDGGWIGNIYTTILTSLKPNTLYYYQVSGVQDAEQFFSQRYSFISAPSPSSDGVTYVKRDLSHIGSNHLFNEPLEIAKLQSEDATKVFGSPVIALFADMGTTSSSKDTAASLIQLAQNQSINLVVHSGDISYADADESIWDEYFNMIEPIASVVPYMTTPGNHDIFYDFAAYYNRFTMPVESSNSPSKQYYSFNYQNIHFVSWSVEQSNGTDLKHGKDQYKWLENDLKIANQNRDKQPWIVLFGHRPLYCSANSVDCSQNAPYYRHLIEQLINDYHVDIVLAGHKHNYERTYPVYKSSVLSTSYVDPPAPVYFVIGTGGKPSDKFDDFIDPLPVWSAAQGSKYGYALLTAPNATTLEMTYVSKSYNVYDSLTLSRTAPFW